MQRGFTFPEVLVIFLIVALTATLAIPSVNNGLAARELESAAMLLASDLRYLQQLSLNAAPGKTYTLVFRNAAPFGYYLMSNLQVVKQIQFDSSIELKAPPPSVSFSAAGVPKSGYTITLRSKKIGKFKYILIEGAIGRVRVSDSGA